MSVWMKGVKQEHGRCCVVVLEPVDRVSAWVAFQSDVSLCSGLSCLQPGHASPSLPWALGQKVGVRVLEGQSPSAEPVSIRVLGPGTQCPCLSFLNCKIIELF